MTVLQPLVNTDDGLANHGDMRPEITTKKSRHRTTTTIGNNPTTNGVPTSSKTAQGSFAALEG